MDAIISINKDSLHYYNMPAFLNVWSHQHMRKTAFKIGFDAMEVSVLHWIEPKFYIKQNI